MKKYTIDFNELKKLVDGLKHFDNQKNFLNLTFGAGPSKGDKMPCLAVLVNGGYMIKKGFYMSVLENEDGNSYATVHVKARDFINHAYAFIAYEEDIAISISATALGLSVGTSADVQLPLSDECEPPLPFDTRKSLVAFQLGTENFLNFLRKGCYLSDDEDVRNIADRVVIKFNSAGDGSLTGFSMDGYAFATSELSLGTNDNGNSNYIIYPLLLLERLKKKAESMIETSTEAGDALLKLIEDAEKIYIESGYKDSSKISELSEKEDIDLSEFSFSLPVKSLEILKAVIKGTKKIQIAITDMYCIVLTATATAIFTLGSTVPTIYHGLSSLTQSTPIAEVVVDTQTILKDLSLLSLSASETGNKIPLHLTLANNSLCMKLKDSSTAATCLEHAGKLDKVSVNISNTLLRKVVGNMDKGNLYVALRTEPGNMLEIRNGSLTDKAKSLTLLLLIQDEDLGDDVTEEDNNDSEEE